MTRGDAKLRYRSPAMPADVERTPDGFRLRFDEPAYGVAPGQTAVVYEGDAVVGVGHDRLERSLTRNLTPAIDVMTREEEDSAVTPDQITLTIPRDRALYSVAHLVLGGLGSRLDLTIEHLEDLQLAVDAVLERSREARST